MIRSCSILLFACCSPAVRGGLSIRSGPRVSSSRWTAQRRVMENGAVAVRGRAHRRRSGRGPRSIDAYQPQTATRSRPDAILMPGPDRYPYARADVAVSRNRRRPAIAGLARETTSFPAEAKNVDREFVRWGTRLACLEMALSGTTTYTDMYYFEDAIAEETKKAAAARRARADGDRLPCPGLQDAQATLAGTEKYIQRFKDDPLIVPAVAPHSIYTISEEYLKASRALADRYGVPLLIHLSETQKENQDSLAKHKMTPTALLESLGVLNGRTLGAHGVWLDDNDLRILKSHGTGLAHCPSSNVKLGSGVARVPEILKAGIDMGLGTDGFAGSNNDASLFEEMDLAAKIQKITRARPHRASGADGVGNGDDHAAPVRSGWRRRSDRSSPASVPT